MIPTFPKFKSLEWCDKAEVQQITSCFPPYSDFNFVSMWSWNTRKKMLMSVLNGNLVLLFYDYVSEAPFLSFIGTNELTDTCIKLIEYSILHYQVNALKLIPETVAANLQGDMFKVVPDADAHDYIISVPYLISLDTISKSNNQAGYLCQKFLRLYPGFTIQKHAAKEIVKEEYIELFKRWAKIKNLDHWELNEYSAFDRFLHNEENDNTIISLYDGEKMMGFTSYEILSPDYAICHFAKADKNYQGVYDGLFFAVGKVLHESNIRYWNFEQDLGIPGLRQAKRKYKPVFYLKKFIVEMNN
jgi:hypothetical protein